MTRERYGKKGQMGQMGQPKGSQKRRRRLTAAEKRALASAGLVVTRYTPDGERATVEQLTAEASERRNLQEAERRPSERSN
jgi:hypothetical protein